MRKVLLTTTALVALGGVSAASAIDISGSYGVEYYSESNTGGSADAADVRVTLLTKMASSSSQARQPQIAV